MVMIEVGMMMLLGCDGDADDRDDGDDGNYDDGDDGAGGTGGGVVPCCAVGRTGKCYHPLDVGGLFLPGSDCTSQLGVYAFQW